MSVKEEAIYFAIFSLVKHPTFFTPTLTPLYPESNYHIRYSPAMRSELGKAVPEAYDLGKHSRQRKQFFSQYAPCWVGENNFYFFMKKNEMLAKQVTNNNGKILLTLNKFWASRWYRKQRYMWGKLKREASLKKCKRVDPARYTPTWLWLFSNIDIISSLVRWGTILLKLSNRPIWRSKTLRYHQAH